MDLLITGIATVIVGTLSMIGNIYGARKSAAKTEALLAYRMTQLEQKVDKHNNLVERVYGVEKRLDVSDEKFRVANHRIDDLEKAQ